MKSSKINMGYSFYTNFIWVYLYWISINYKNKTGYCISKLACSQTQRERERDIYRWRFEAAERSEALACTLRAASISSFRLMFSSRFRSYSVSFSGAIGTRILQRKREREIILEGFFFFFALSFRIMN